MQSNRNPPFFSFIVPVYNTAEYLYRCMDSLVNQSFKDIEIICVDDNSTDTSLEILTDYMKKDSRVHVIHHTENKKSFTSRVSAIQHCTGKYVLFSDSDDWVETDMCQTLFEVLSETAYDVVEFGFRKMPSNEEIYYPKTHGVENDTIAGYLSGRYPISLWTRCYNAELVRNREFPMFTGYVSDDMLFTIIFNDGRKSKKYLEKYFYNYSVRPDSYVYTLEKLEDMSRDSVDVASQVLSYVSAHMPECMPLAQQLEKVFLGDFFHRYIPCCEDKSMGFLLINKYFSPESIYYYIEPYVAWEDTYLEFKRSKFFIWAFNIYKTLKKLFRE